MESVIGDRNHRSKLTEKTFKNLTLFAKNETYMRKLQKYDVYCVDVKVIYNGLIISMSKCVECDLKYERSTPL